MLGGVLCATRSHKPWLLTPLSFAHGGGCGAAAHHRLVVGGSQNKVLEDRRRRHHSTACGVGVGGAAAAASIWHAICPAANGSRFHRPAFHHEQKGEGSWNVSWDARPARWLHRLDSAWLLFGVCACLAAPLEFFDLTAAEQPVPAVNVAVNEKIDGSCTETVVSDASLKTSANYRVTGVLADGRCLFRSIAHMACLRNGEEAPDDQRQTELADQLRAQVVDELILRRKETEWFIEGDFDAYVERIRKTYVWGGEPELLMASHVLKSMISVYMVDRSTGSLINIANYGEEYRKDEETPIKVLFHGYGHYDILESVSEQSFEKAEV